MEGSDIELTNTRQTRFPPVNGSADARQEHRRHSTGDAQRHDVPYGRLLPCAFCMRRDGAAIVWVGVAVLDPALTFRGKPDPGSGHVRPLVEGSHGGVGGGRSLTEVPAISMASRSSAAGRATLRALTLAGEVGA